jgi:hypothetical protein
MDIGDRVLVELGSNRFANGQVIDFKDDMLVIAGDEEIKRSSAEGRKPLGLTFPRKKIREK